MPNWFGGPDLTDKGLSYLTNMKKLNHLKITGAFSDEGLRHLEGLKAKVREFAKKHDLSWPQVRIGQKSKVAANYAVDGAPAYFVIGPDGKIVSMSQDWRKLHDAITKALAVNMR